LYKLAADGRLLWKFKTGAWIMASPVIDERGRVYFGSYDKCFYAVDAGGKPLWRFEGRASFSATAVIDAAGNVYCGDQSGTVFALDGRGRLRWQYKAEDFITSGLTILPGKNLLLVGSIDGKLLAFHCDRPLSRRAWWAKYLGDLRNSGRDE
ncbi:MAG TPA: PQQ-binding-like beta-propeller repeat protein, partial [Candidatus Aminicenantes bacterium]|nr:PQQ-binding-like beta-propeller repeat protein [Candidatus Aminicenantes bacterium]